MQSIQSLLDSAFSVVNNSLVPLVFALILVAFFWGLVRYVYNADSEQGRDQGKRIMVGGVIAVFIAASIWGIVEFLQRNLTIQEGDSQPAPQAPSSNTSGGWPDSIGSPPEASYEDGDDSSF